MPRLTKILFRRDTAANWSSTNPTLDSGEAGFDTTNKVLKIGDGATAWAGLPVLAQTNMASAARPLLTVGAYLDGSTGLVLSGLASNYASAPDSAALSITGDIDIKVKAQATDWTPSARQYIVAKWANSQQSYGLGVNTDGKLRLAWSTAGSDSLTVDSTVSNTFTDGTMNWIRATMQVNDGAGNRNVKFYTSTDGTTWTQLGTTVTTAGTTSIYDGTATLDTGANSTIGGLFTGTVARLIIQSAYDTANNTSNVAFDADFSSQVADALAFTESSSNAATVTINTTRYSYGLPGAEIQANGTYSISSNNDHYEPFIVPAPITIDMIHFEVTAAPALNTTLYIGMYACDNNFQPTGSPLINQSQALTTSTTGIFRKQFTPITIQPGNYLMALSTGVSPTLRRYNGGPTFMSGATPDVVFRTGVRTSAAFTSSPVAWTEKLTNNSGFFHHVLLRWKAA